MISLPTRRNLIGFTLPLLFNFTLPQLFRFDLAPVTKTLKSKLIVLAQAIEEFISHLDVLSYDAKASQHYGQIKAALEKKGEIIGENDIHIAAHSISQGLILVSNNLKEFMRVPNLALENWV